MANAEWKQRKDDENKWDERENVRDKILFVHHSLISIPTKYHYSYKFKKKLHQHFLMFIEKDLNLLK